MVNIGLEYFSYHWSIANRVLVSVKLTKLFIGFTLALNILGKSFSVNFLSQTIVIESSSYSSHKADGKIFQPLFSRA